MKTAMIRAAGVAALWVGLAGLGTANAAPLVVMIGNGPDAVDGSYINSGSLATTMAFTWVWVQADSTVEVVDDSDLANSSGFGPTVFDLSLLAPTVSINGQVTMGGGNIHLEGQTVNLNDVLVANDGTTLLDNTRLLGSAATVNVNGSGSAAQASLFAFYSGAANLNVLGGNHSDESLSATAPNLHTTMLGGILENVTIGAGNVFDWYGGQLLGANGAGIFGFGGVANIYGTSFQLGPNTGSCSTLLESQWSAAPAQVTNAAHCVRGVLADGSGFVSNFGTNGTVNFVASAVVPVPAAVWLFASAMLCLGGLRRRG